MGIFNRKKAGANNPPAAVREFNRLKEGETLPRDGACAFFYAYFSYAGETLPIRDGGQYVLFHIENDDVVQEIVSGVPSWHVLNDGESLLLSLLFRTGGTMNHIQLPLDRSKEGNADMLRFLTGAKTIRVNLLNFVYGGIVKEKVIDVPIPGNITAEIKKAVG